MSDETLRDAVQALVLLGDFKQLRALTGPFGLIGNRCMWCLAKPTRYLVDRTDLCGGGFWLCVDCDFVPEVRTRFASQFLPFAGGAPAPLILDDVRDALQALIFAGELEEALELARDFGVHGKRCLWCLAHEPDPTTWLCTTCNAIPGIRNRVVRVDYFDDGSFLQIGPPILCERPDQPHPGVATVTVHTVPLVTVDETK